MKNFIFCAVKRDQHRAVNSDKDILHHIQFIRIRIASKLHNTSDSARAYHYIILEIYALIELLEMSNRIL